MCKSYCFYCVRYISCDYRWFQWLGYNWLRTLSAIIDLYSTNSIQFIQTQTHNHPLTPTVSGICIFWHAGSDPETHFMKHSNNLKVKKGRRRHGSNPAGREGTWRWDRRQRAGWLAEWSDKPSGLAVTGKSGAQESIIRTSNARGAEIRIWLMNVTTAVDGLMHQVESQGWKQETRGSDYWGRDKSPTK